MGENIFRMRFDVVALVLIPGMVGTVLLPQLIHALDHGEERIPLSRIQQGTEFESRNLVVTNARMRDIVQVENIPLSPRHSTGPHGVKGYVAMVPSDWDGKHDVQLVVMIGSRRSLGLLSELSDSLQFQGIARNVLWEGLEDHERHLFTKRGVKLADKVLLLEHGVTPLDDLFVFAVGVGLSIVAVVTAIVIAGRWRDSRSSRHVINKEMQ